MSKSSTQYSNLLRLSSVTFTLYCYRFLPFALRQSGTTKEYIGVGSITRIEYKVHSSMDLKMIRL